MRRRRVSGSDYGWILPLGVIAVGGYLVYQFMNSSSLTTGTSANNATTDANTASTVANDLAASQAAGVQQTISDSTLSGYADTLFQLLGNGGDPGTIAQTVDQVNNMTDWLRLVQLFGTRQFATSSFSTCALLGLGCQSYDLQSALRAVLPASEIANINTYFSDQGIQVVL